MPYCPRCGTENDPSVTRCPLCATELPRFNDLGPGEPAWPSAASETDRIWATPKQKRRFALVLVAAALLFPAMVVTGVDALVSGRVTWSWIPDLVLGGGFAMVATGFALARRPWVWMASELLIVAALLAAIDALDGSGFDWSWRLGWPLTFWSGAAVVAAALLTRRTKEAGWNLLGNWALGLAAYCGGVEGLVRLYLPPFSAISWSVIVALVLVPFGVLFHVLHSALGRRLNLRQTFHL